jgi:hypothetical protein
MILPLATKSETESLSRGLQRQGDVGLVETQQKLLSALTLPGA